MRADAGFTLLEIVCVLAMVALIASILLPRLGGGTTQPRLEAYAVDVAALLKSDRNAALRRRGTVAALVDARARTISSGSNGRTIRVPDDVVFDALLPELCEGRPVLSTISFFASGMSCGGAVGLTRFGRGFQVKVNWLTGGIDIVAQNSP